MPALIVIPTILITAPDTTSVSVMSVCELLQMVDNAATAVTAGVGSTLMITVTGGAEQSTPTLLPVKRGLIVYVIV
jgi:hypothetical protein